MSPLLFVHPHGARHDVPEGHPERAARLDAFLAGLSDSDGRPLGFARLDAPEAAPADLLRCHTQAYLDRLADPLPRGRRRVLDSDTSMGEGSWASALQSAGGALAGMAALLEGRAQTAAVAARPPGHHALAHKAMGFCLLGNAALAAQAAVAAGARPAVLDIDVHHGNGTQALLHAQRETFFASTHCLDAWPGTGRASQQGLHGTQHNAPLPMGADGAMALHAWSNLLQETAAFRPDVLVVSAGFDAHRDDPLGGMSWDDGTYRSLGAAIGETAHALCNGTVLVLLEGGYDLGVLRRCGRAFFEGLLFASSSKEVTP